MEKRWQLRERGNENVVEQLSAELSIDPVLTNLLVQRGIDTFEKARTFFRPQLSDLYDPFLMKDMNIAIDRIGSAMARNEKILVYGDYDVDGTTSVALIYTFFRQFYQNMGYYIPDRYTEGYGISFKGVDYAAENNYTLIIALDCGIKAIDKVEYAARKKIDFIICDHHRPGNELPAATAVLDPQRPDCNYPFRELSGCGVGFKLIHAYARINSIPFESIVPLLDLVAVSIASDIVPLVDENRVMAYFGLKQLNTNPRLGLRSIIKTAGIENKEITIEDIVFRIGPRINAAGRIESGTKAVELLIASDDKLAHDISDKINTFNNTRKNIDRNITREAMQMISSNPRRRNASSTVLFNPDWHKGVIGIVASRLIETYYRPTVILTESNGFVTGSARSVNGFDLYNAIEACSDLLENFGGHMYAAGLTLRPENLEEFSERFEQVVRKTITPEQMIPVVDIDGEMDFPLIDNRMIRILNQFRPFGPENMAPVFVTRRVRDVGTGRIVGNTGEHLKLDLVQEGHNHPPLGAIAFHLAHHFDRIRNGQPFDVCYTIEENEFRGITSIQLMVKDIKGLE
ncbi:MAG TPA: single-stranded-DNA-specific exonuclease RecJ [Bacteroidetes bacterium]|nr:single-stranded-DNA-specific exonuclease RecJ [Bacteroidota bacterium]